MTTHPPRPPRFAIRLSAEIKTPEGALLTGTTRNLSEGGVCVETDRMIAEGGLISLVLFVVEDDIEAEGKRTLNVRGTVQWAAEADHGGYQVGVKFVELTPADDAMIKAALSRLS